MIEINRFIKTTYQLKVRVNGKFYYVAEDTQGMITAFCQKKEAFDEAKKQCEKTDILNLVAYHTDDEYMVYIVVFFTEPKKMMSLLPETLLGHAFIFI